jgi:hypothetical protein
VTYNRQSYLERALKSLDVSAKSKSVALALAFRSEFNAPSVPYSVPVLVSLTGLHRATVQRALRELEEAGFIRDVTMHGRKTVATINAPTPRLAVVEGSKPVSQWDRYFRQDGGVWTVRADWVVRAAPVDLVARYQAENAALGLNTIPVCSDLFEAAQ